VLAGDETTVEAEVGHDELLPDPPVSRMLDLGNANLADQQQQQQQTGGAPC
jgi:hypothetical protein